MPPPTQRTSSGDNFRTTYYKVCRRGFTKETRLRPVVLAMCWAGNNGDTVLFGSCLPIVGAGHPGSVLCQTPPLSSLQSLKRSLRSSLAVVCVLCCVACCVLLL